ncbi:MAG: hypothetical protein ACREC8_10675, partial [Limisphaerales bacterium]
GNTWPIFVFCGWIIFFRDESGVEFRRITENGNNVSVALKLSRRKVFWCDRAGKVSPKVFAPNSGKNKRLTTLKTMEHCPTMKDEAINPSGLIVVGQKLQAYSKAADFTAKRGLVVELFPFIYGASRRMSARAISRFLEKEQQIKLSSVTITKALNDPEKNGNLYFDLIEPHARVWEKDEKIPMKDFLFRDKYFPEPSKSRVFQAAARMVVKAEVIQAVRVLRGKWFSIDYETRLQLRPLIENRLEPQKNRK